MVDELETKEDWTPVKAPAQEVFLHLPSQWKIPRVGDIIEGTVLKKLGSVVFIDLGFATGIIYGKEYQEGRYILKLKEEGEALVTKIVELENWAKQHVDFIRRVLHAMGEVPSI